MTDPLRTVQLLVPDGTAEAYVAGPDDRSAPGVLLFMDALGLRPQIGNMLERIAGWGYTVLAPNVFYRNGSVADLVDDRDHTIDRVRGLTPEHIAADAPSYLSALRDRCADGPLATTGYCMGARLAVRTATAHPDDVAAVGGLPGGGLATEDPDSPHLGLPQARAEFVFGHADHDRSMPPEAVGQLRRGAIGRRSAVHQRRVRRSAARVHDERHGEVPRGDGRAALPRARGTPRADLEVTDPQEVAESAATAMYGPATGPARRWAWRSSRSGRAAPCCG